MVCALTKKRNGGGQCGTKRNRCRSQNGCVDRSNGRSRMRGGAEFDVQPPNPGRSDGVGQGSGVAWNGDRNSQLNRLVPSGSGSPTEEAPGRFDFFNIRDRFKKITNQETLDPSSSTSSSTSSTKSMDSLAGRVNALGDVVESMKKSMSGFKTKTGENSTSVKNGFTQITAIVEDLKSKIQGYSSEIARNTSDLANNNGDASNAEIMQMIASLRDLVDKNEGGRQPSGRQSVQAGGYTYNNRRKSTRKSTRKSMFRGRNRSRGKS